VLGAPELVFELSVRVDVVVTLPWLGEYELVRLALLVRVVVSFPVSASFWMSPLVSLRLSLEVPPETTSELPTVSLPLQVKAKTKTKG